MPATAERIRTRAVELGVYLPLGAYSKAREELSEIELSPKRLRSLLDDLIERGEKRLQPIERNVRKRVRTLDRRGRSRSGPPTSGAKKTTRSAPRKKTAGTN